MRASKIMNIVLNKENNHYQDLKPKCFKDWELQTL